MTEALFNYYGVISSRLQKKLSGYQQFQFPEKFFRGIQTEGYIKAVAADYFSGKPLTRVVFVQALIRRQEVKLAVAAADERIVTALLSEYNGLKNLIVRFVQREQYGEEPIVNPRKNLPPIYPPNFAYQPEELPAKIGRPLSRPDKVFSNWLITQVQQEWQTLGVELSAAMQQRYIRLAVESMIRSNPARIDTLMAWRILTPEDADAIERRSYSLSPDRIARMLLWLIGEQQNLGGASATQVENSLNKLLPHFYIEYLVKKFKNKGITRNDVLYFAHRYSLPAEKIEQTLKTARELASLRKISVDSAWYFAKHYPDDPDGAWQRADAAEKEITGQFEIPSRWAKLIAREYSAPLAAAITISRKFKQLKTIFPWMSESSLWFCAVNYPIKTAQKIKIKAVRASHLAKKLGVSLKMALQAEMDYENAEEWIMKVKREAQQIVNEFNVLPSLAMFIASNYREPAKAAPRILQRAEALAARFKIRIEDARYLCARFPRSCERVAKSIIRHSRRYAFRIGEPYTRVFRILLRFPNITQEKLQEKLRRAG